MRVYDIHVPGLQDSAPPGVSISRSSISWGEEQRALGDQEGVDGGGGGGVGRHLLRHLLVPHDNFDRLSLLLTVTKDYYGKALRNEEEYIFRLVACCPGVERRQLGHGLSSRWTVPLI